MSARPRAQLLLVAASLLVFLFFAAAWIHLPGPQHDELLEFPVLAPSLASAVAYSIDVRGHHVPVMVMSYVGALKGWLLGAWFLVVPRGIPGWRALGVVLGLATVWLIFVVVRRHYGPPVALLTMALVATDPTFIHTIRLDYGPVAVSQFLKMAGLALLSSSVSAGSRAAFAGAMLFFGLAVWDKAIFVWFLAGLAGTVVLLYPREGMKRVRAQPAASALGIAALLLGALPFIAYNATSAAETWHERGRFEVRWFKLLEAEAAFTGTFMQALTGESQLADAPPARDIPFRRVANWMYRLGARRETIQLPLLALAVALLPLNLWITRDRRRLLFPLALSLLTYACMFFTFEGGASAHHVILLQPFPLLFVAASLWTPAERWPALIPRAAAAAVAVAAIAANFSVNARLLAIYTRTGGAGPFTDAVYRLVPWLAQHPGRNIYAIDWGLSNPIMFLGERSNLYVDDVFFGLNSPQDPNHAAEVSRLGALMRDPNNIFLVHSPQRTLFPTPAREFFALAAGGIDMREIVFFEERSGEVVYEVYQHGSPPSGLTAKPVVEVDFTPSVVKPQQEYVIQARELANSWIDLVGHIDQMTSSTATRFCRLDGEGRARITVPANHPAATIRIVFIRRSGGEWRPARGSITVVRP